jgi:hemerythrin-like domain-containing protein
MTTKKNGRSNGRNGGGRDAPISMLKEDHKNVRKLLRELEDTTEEDGAKRTELLAEIARMVRAHSQLEEELFYPAYLAACTKADEEKLYYEAAEEHHVVDLVLPEIETADVESPEFAGKAKVLKDLIEHHAEEEETEMFPKATKLIDKDEMADLGERMRARKEELESEEPEPAGRREGERPRSRR